jgi:hypothetical protein
MEQLTADGGSPRDSSPASLPDNPALKPTASAVAGKELDRALAGAIRRLIAGQNALIGIADDRDSRPVV